MYKPHRFNAYQTLIDPQDDNTILAELMNKVTPKLEAGRDVCDRTRIDRFNEDVSKYCVIRSIQKLGCQNPMILWVAYNKHGEFNYTTSPGGTRWNLWEATQTWKLPMVIIDQTREAPVEKYFHNLKTYDRSIIMESQCFNIDPPLDAEGKIRTGHKFRWIEPDQMEDWEQAEHRLMYSDANALFFEDYRDLLQQKKRLKIMLNDQQAFVWGLPENGTEVVTVDTQLEVYRTWLKYMNIPC